MEREHRWAINERDTDDWLGADDLARILPKDRAAALGANALRRDRVLFLDREVALDLCRKMCGRPWKRRYVVRRILI